MLFIIFTFKIVCDFIKVFKLKTSTSKPSGKVNFNVLEI